MSGLLHGRVALVTGASRGIGAAAAIELGRLGAHVVLTARTQGGLEETDDAIHAAGGTATLLPMDLRESENVDKIGPSIYTRFDRLDILVHAAGALGKLTPVSHMLDGDWAEAMTVNLAAAWRLIRSCAPVLAASDAGRAVFVTDARARAPSAYWGMYGASKAGMEHLVLTWAAEVRTTAMRVNLFDPGVVASRLRGNAMPGEDPSKLATAGSVAPGLAALCLPGEVRHGVIAGV